MCFSSSLHFFVLVQQKMEFVETTFVHRSKQSLTRITWRSILQVSAVSGFYLFIFLCVMLLMFYLFLFCQPPSPPPCISVGITVSVRCRIKSHRLPAEDVEEPLEDSLYLNLGMRLSVEHFPVIREALASVPSTTHNVMCQRMPVILTLSLRGRKIRSYPWILNEASLSHLRPHCHSNNQN